MKEMEMEMRFAKYHALGNDYIVIDPAAGLPELTPAQIRVLCHRNYGVGSDGILFGPLPAENADVGLRIFNPDGSEAEKSGNGLRIFTRFLWDAGRITDNSVTIHTLGGIVPCKYDPTAGIVTCEMGKVSFDSAVIPMLGPAREVLNETITAAGETLSYCAASVGNPHCVILKASVSADEARRLGPLIETDKRFPNRTNVQFMQILDRHAIRLEIWERGAGYTLASGSSSSAAAAVARRLGLCEAEIAVHMPGGVIQITVFDDFTISMRGPVTKVAEGVLSPELFAIRIGNDQSTQEL